MGMQTTSTGQQEGLESAKKQISAGSRRRSTGPRTERGKQRSRYNALKHGIFSKVLLLEGESRAEYQSLVKGVRDSLQPQGTLEETLVEELVCFLWRRRRLLQAERAEVTEAVEFQRVDVLQEQLSEADDRHRLGHAAGGMLSGCSNPFLLKRAVHELGILRGLLEAAGFNGDMGFTILRRVYGLSPEGEMTSQLFRFYSVLASMADSYSGETELRSPEQLKFLMLGFIDQEIKHLEREIKWLEEIDEQRTAYQVEASLVPSQESLDRLLRYEAHLSREFDRTLSQLERLQRMRLGQPVPPPVKVQLST